MAFNGSGTFVRLRSWIDDRNNGVKIVADRHDAEDDGFAAGLTNVICKDGQSITTQRIPFAAGVSVSNGTVGTPAVNFTADTNTGLYRIGADNIGIAANGAKVADISTTGLSITGTLASSGAMTITSTSALALAVGPNGATNPVLLADASTASAATGLRVQGLAAGAGLVVAAISSGTDENMILDAKGAGQVYLGLNSTGGATLASGGGQVTINTAPASLLNQGRFSRLSSSAVQFVPFNGSMIKINGLHYPIPAGGVAGGTSLFSGNTTVVGGSAGGNLASDSFYYVYVFVSSGTLTFNFAATAHATSSTAGNVGTEILTAVNTNTLVGAIYTLGGAIVDSDAARCVISWFNRRPRRVRGIFTAQRTTTSTSLAEINSETRCNFICWSDEALTIGLTGQAKNNTANESTVTGIGIDGATAEATTNFETPTSGTINFPICVSETRTGFTEAAVHYATIVGLVSAGTATYPTSGVGYTSISGFLRG